MTRRVFIPWRRLAAVGLLVVALLGCGVPMEDGPDASRPTDAPVVLATSRLGSITHQEIDQFVGRLGTAYRPDPQQPLTERYRDLARRLVLESLLLENAEDEADADLHALDLQHQVDVYSLHHLSTLEPPPAITEEDLLAAYAERRDLFRLEETRRVRHIFLRYPEGGDPRTTWRRIEDIRQQIVEGRPFERMAREVSDSETRHRDGLLGFVTRGTFPPDFDRVVFALEPKVPSAPISTAEGAHLFYVSNILEARDPSFEEVRELLVQALRVERQAEHLRAAAEALPVPDKSHRVEPKMLRRLLRNGQDDREILRVGDFTLTLGALREQLAPVQRALGELADDRLAEQWLAEWHDRARIYSAMRTREAAGERIDLPRDSIAARHRQQQVEGRLRSAMRAHVENDPERLARHHADHAMRFATPLRLEIDRLTVSIADATGPEADASMARLEAARESLDNGARTLASLAESMGGEITRLGPMTIPELARFDSMAIRFAALLRAGEHSPPYRAGDSLTLFTVMTRVEPQPRPLDVVREQVVEDILKQQGPALLHEVSEAMLSAASFTIDERALARLTARP